MGGSGTVQGSMSEMQDHMTGRIDELAIYDLAGMDAQQIEAKVVRMAASILPPPGVTAGQCFNPRLARRLNGLSKSAVTKSQTKSSRTERKDCEKGDDPRLVR